ncbi:hypothetical protein [Streptomyces sp. NBC_01089]|uniref:hypothetical protein n=1 Tax=Streptomyces sp. NBC_01089 TaxID=2903747 RepID=UPI003866EFE1|nr:hypothetical protein OG510_26555 [Streptomyces sp. NBC_01089]
MPSTSAAVAANPSKDHAVSPDSSYALPSWPGVARTTAAASAKSCWWFSVYQPLRRKVAGMPEAVISSSVALWSAASSRIVVGASSPEV